MQSEREPSDKEVQECIGRIFAIAELLAQGSREEAAQLQVLRERFKNHAQTILEYRKHNHADTTVQDEKIP